MISLTSPKTLKTTLKKHPRLPQVSEGENQNPPTSAFHFLLFFLTVQRFLVSIGNGTGGKTGGLKGVFLAHTAMKLSWDFSVWLSLWRGNLMVDSFIEKSSRHSCSKRPMDCRSFCKESKTSSNSDHSSWSSSFSSSFTLKAIFSIWSSMLSFVLSIPLWMLPLILVELCHKAAEVDQKLRKQQHWRSKPSRSTLQQVAVAEVRKNHRTKVMGEVKPVIKVGWDIYIYTCMYVYIYIPPTLKGLEKNSETHLWDHL